MNLAACAALSAALAIGAGAFGAHAAANVLAAEWLKTGSAYLLPHAIAALWLSERYPRIAVLLLSGALLFAGTLYAMALGGPRWLGAITPLGGAAMITGWVALAWKLRQRKR